MTHNAGCDVVCDVSYDTPMMLFDIKRLPACYVIYIYIYIYIYRRKVKRMIELSGEK